MQDAAAEIEFCFRYLTGELCATANLAAYGIVVGGGSPYEMVEDRALKLLPDYYEWQKKLRLKDPDALRVVNFVVLEGLGLRKAGEAADLFCIAGPSMGAAAGSLLLKGLNEYCVLRGWGDIMADVGVPYYGYVYIIGGESVEPPFKVGYSVDPRRRLKDLQIGSPVALKLHYVAHLKKGTRSAEGKIHRQLKKHKVRGEWFDASVGYIVDVIRIMYPDCVDAEFA